MSWVDLNSCDRVGLRMRIFISNFACLLSYRLGLRASAAWECSNVALLAILHLVSAIDLHHSSTASATAAAQSGVTGEPLGRSVIL